jgi:hypothetical protein
MATTRRIHRDRPARRTAPRTAYDYSAPVSSAVPDVLAGLVRTRDAFNATTKEATK